jgi:CheY-like chemotaxis protein
MSTDSVILLAEDRDDDALIFLKAIRRAQISTRVVHVKDGEEAINYLAGVGEYSDRERYPLPCVVITDLKMPKMSGFDVLEWLQSQTNSHIPRAIVLSGSDVELDKQRALRLGAEAYWTKPADPEALINLARELENGQLPREPTVGEQSGSRQHNF